VVPGVAAILGRDGVAVNIVCDGPANKEVSEGVSNLPGVRVSGMVGDTAGGLPTLLLPSRVRWAPYDLGLATYDLSDRLKIKDYLAVGMSVVNTPRRSVAGGATRTYISSVPAVVEATHRTLAELPRLEPPASPMLVDASRPLRAFVSALQAVQ
jgi:hypothetical protein